MQTLHTETCVIGGGPGGLACADLLALRGRDVVVVNSGSLMGYGIEGAFKSKAEFEITRQYVYASLRPEVFGPVRAPSFDTVLRGVRRAADGLSHALAERLTRLGVRVLSGFARFEDPHTVCTDDVRIVADHVVVATGTRPWVPDGVTLVPDQVMTSDTVLALDEQPDSMVILGAGVIGCEFANIFAALGAEVHLVDSQPRILGSEDEDVSRFVMRQFERYGIRVLPSCRFESLEVRDNRVHTTLSDGTRLESAAALLAIGRSSGAAAIAPEAAGLVLDDRGYLATDDTMRTNVPHIYAVGDVGRRNTPLDMALVHVAQAEGRRAAQHILGLGAGGGMDHVPYIIFTIPMLAGAGLSERDAVARHGAVRVGKYPYGRNHRAHALSSPIGFTKLIVGPPGDDRILGVRVVGRDADTLVSAASIMIERELPYTYLLDSIMPHPSLMECLQGAAHIITGDALRYEEGEEFAVPDARDGGAV